VTTLYRRERLLLPGNLPAKGEVQRFPPTSQRRLRSWSTSQFGPSLFLAK